MVANRYVTITAEQLEHALAKPDLTEPFDAHAVGLMAKRVLLGLEPGGWPAATVKRGARVVAAEENYGLLGDGAEEVTLGSEHTRWVDSRHLLRTQTTSLIPLALQTAAARYG